MSVVAWHEVECGAYAADLPFWEELAKRAQGPVLDLGCGSGRVALHLARRGHRVTGLDVDAGLVDAFAARAGELAAEALVGDATDFDLAGEFALALAPMQLAQLLTAEERQRCLRCVATPPQGTTGSLSRFGPTCRLRRLPIRISAAPAAVNTSICS